MYTQIEELIESLKGMTDAIKRGYAPASTPDKIGLPLYNVINSNFQSISKEQIINLVDGEIKRIKELKVEFDEGFLNQLIDLAGYIDIENVRIETLLNQTNPMFLDKVIQVLSFVNLTFQEYLDWEHVNDVKKIPREVKTRINNLVTLLDSSEIATTDIQNKIKIINEAYDAANELPILLDDLQKYNKEIKSLKDSSEGYTLKVQHNIEVSKTSLEKVQSDQEQTNKLLKEAEQIITKMEEKLAISTSLGLAYAFQQRSEKLQRQSYWWTFGFIISLAATFLIAYFRFNDLKNIINQDTPISYILIQLVISIISLSAPLWFALISSKQIQKLFVLSEDYAYKASISESYEGYRKEAHNIDPDLVTQLLTTALTKVDEAPLRLIGNEKSLSPLEEIMNNQTIQGFFKEFPELKDQIVSTLLGSKKEDKNVSKDVS